MVRIFCEIETLPNGNLDVQSFIKIPAKKTHPVNGLEIRLAKAGLRGLRNYLKLEHNRYQLESING